MTVIKQGQIVFNRSGERGRYSGVLGGIHYVAPEIITYGWEGEESREWGDPVPWSELFPKAPVSVLEERVAELNARVEQRRNELSQVGAEHEEMQKRISAAAKISPDLARLLDWIEGKITHVILEDYSDLRIAAIADLHKENNESSNWDKKIPLVSLYGDSGKNLGYRINQYRDGSGSSKRLWLCKSMEDAEAQRLAIVRDELASEAATVNVDQPYNLERCVARAEKYGVPVSADIFAIVDAYRDKRDAAELTRLKQYVAQQQSRVDDHIAAIAARKARVEA